MPRFDSTGPTGAGPTGWRRGGCRTVTGSLKTGRGRLAGSALVTVFGLALHDARNPDGLTRSLIRAVGGKVRRLLAKRQDAGKAALPHDDTPGLPGG